MGHPLDEYDVELFFDGNGLVSWEKRLVSVGMTFTPSGRSPGCRTDDRGYSSVIGCGSPEPFDPNEIGERWQKYWEKKDKKHHKKGHKHHHYDHDDDD